MAVLFHALSSDFIGPDRRTNALEVPGRDISRQDGGVPTSGVAHPKALAGVAAGVPVPYSGVTAIATSGEAATVSRSGVATGEAAGVPHIAGAPTSSCSVVASCCATEMVAPPTTKNANATIMIKRRMHLPPCSPSLMRMIRRASEPVDPPSEARQWFAAGQGNICAT